MREEIAILEKCYTDERVANRQMANELKGKCLDNCYEYCRALRYQDHDITALMRELEEKIMELERRFPRDDPAVDDTSSDNLPASLMEMLCCAPKRV
ncbi:unnamed protein product, partial [Mesorhabditis spiculigera]